jgi:post-segregation antitoxin (ccd killing protein)
MVTLFVLLDVAMQQHCYLAVLVLEIKRQKWREGSREAIEEYSLFVEKHGCFGDSMRCCCWRLLS